MPKRTVIVSVKEKRSENVKETTRRKANLEDEETQAEGETQPVQKQTHTSSTT